MSEPRFPRPEARREFRTRLRADLVNEAVRLAEGRRSARRSLWSRLVSPLVVGRLRPIAVALTLVLVLVAGTGAAAAGSLPGDPTFALKLAAEQVEVALAADDDAKVQVLATQAQRRLDDLARVADRRPDKAPTASAEYSGAVSRFAAAVEALRATQPGSKHDAVEKVVEAAREKHLQVLRDLTDRLTAPAQADLERATREHEKIAPSGKPEERSPKKDEQRPAVTPRASETPRGRETPRASETPRGRETPRASETPRSGRPTPTATPAR